MDETCSCEMSYIGVRLISGLRFLDFDEIETAKPCVRTLNGYKGCKLFLAKIELVSDILNIEPRNREYRQKFSENYRTLFPDMKKRMYRVDVLEAAVEGYTSIWVNGERFEFKSEVVANGKVLYESWLCLITLVVQLKDIFEERIRENKHTDIFTLEEENTWKVNTKNTLQKFDDSWVIFEESYINELISIENIARRFILNVNKYFIDRENSTEESEIKGMNKDMPRNSGEKSSMNEESNHIEEQSEYKSVTFSKSCDIENKDSGDGSSTDIHIPEKNYCEYLDVVFFDLIKRLYHVININNKESSSENINFNTWKLLMQINKQSLDTPHNNISVFGAISDNCISELTCLIIKIREICKFPERIDPHICNNTDLQQSIVRLEESWRIANKFFSRVASFSEESLERVSLVKLVKLFQKVFKTKERIRSENKKCVLEEAANKSINSGINNDDYFKKDSLKDVNEIKHQENSSSCSSFIDRLEEFDVGAFLSIPKVCFLLFLLDPLNCSDIVTQFLGITCNNYRKEENKHDISVNELCGKEGNTNKFLSDSDVGLERGIVDKYETKHNLIFKSIDIDNLLLLKVDYNCENSGKESFRKVVDLWNKLSKIVRIYLNDDSGFKIMKLKREEINNNKMEKFGEELLFVFIFSLLIGECLCGLGCTNNCSYCKEKMEMITGSESYDKYFKNVIHSFIFSVEEVSILMQRIYPSEWNEFIKITTICITKTPDITSFKCNQCVYDDINDEDNRNTEYNNINTKNNKIKKFFSNISSIFHSNIKYYGEFALTNDVSEEYVDVSVENEYTCAGNSTNDSSSSNYSSIAGDNIIIL